MQTTSGLTHNSLLQTLEQWDQQIQFPTRLIACGDAALTLLDIKLSTHTVDFIVPEDVEYELLLDFLPTIGYCYRENALCHEDAPEVLYRFWSGNQTFTVELLDSSLNDANHTEIKSWTHIYLGVLNRIDLIITQLFRGTDADMKDCIAIFKTWQVEAEDLLERYANVSNKDAHPDQRMQTFMTFVEKLVSHRLVTDEFLEKVSREKSVFSLV